jgi:hypothetical protein
MKSRSRIADNNTRKTKAKAALPLVGIIVAAALLSGLLTMNSGSYQQPAMAQVQNVTSTNGTTTGGGNTTTSGAGQSACTPTQIGGAAGGTNSTSGNSTGGTTEINATSTTGGGGGNQSTASQVRLHIEEACIAAQNNDTEGLMMQLNLALNALAGAGTQGNSTTAISAGDLDTTTTAGEDELSVGRTSTAEEHNTDDNAADSNDRGDGDSSSSSSSGSTDVNTPETDTAEQDSECGGVTVGGTSAADDYGCDDPDAE